MAGGEVGVDGPGAVELVLGRGVVLGVDIEVADLGEAGAVGLGGDGGNVDDAETGTVVGHVGLAVLDVQVVVDGLGLGLVVAGVDGAGKVADVPDVGGCLGVAAGGGVVLLIELVVEEEMGHGRVGEPALVSVGGTGVGSAGDDTDGSLNGDIVDGEGILVVTEADLTVAVDGIGTSIDDALSIVDVTIGGSTAPVDGSGRVGNIKHVKTTAAPVGADGVDHVGGLVGDDVVGVAKASEAGSDIGGGGEDLGGGESEQLAEIKDLETVAARLGTDIDVAVDDFHVTPDGIGSGCLETAPVLQATITQNLNESGTIKALSVLV